MVAAAFETYQEGDVWYLVASGDWTLRDGLTRIDAQLRKFEFTSAGQDLKIDLTNVGALDTSGAMALQRTWQACQTRIGRQLSDTAFVGAKPVQAALLHQAAQHIDDCSVELERRNSFAKMLERMGMATLSFIDQGLSILSFIGQVLTGIFVMIKNPRRFRLTPMVHHMEESGLDAMPIVGLMSFLIGAVIAFMGTQVLAQFGAEIFAVDLIGVTVLREFGVLLTAILIAGRSGSAYTAQIGSMKLREEIDAMTAMGIRPMEALIIPRVLSMILVMPVLAFLAAMLGLIGGGLVAWLVMDIAPALFLWRLQDVVVVDHFWVGMVKAPFFAFVIAVVGCYQGMNVEASAEDLGRKTTTSVVQSLFLVILLDALFAVFFLELDI